MQSRRMSREPPCVDPDDPVGVFPGPSDGATHHAPERWRETVSAEAVAHLRREGWCVIDGFLSGAGGDERVDADEAEGERPSERPARTASSPAFPGTTSSSLGSQGRRTCGFARLGCKSTQGSAKTGGTFSPSPSCAATDTC